MSVRRGATWLATVCVAFGATVSLGAAPAAAEGETVRVRAPSALNAGGSPGSVTVNVSMRGGDCVNVRTGLGIRLPGLTADRVEVRVAADGDWRPVQVSDGADGLVATQRTAPDRPVLCARKSVSSRYRVSLLAGAPAGRVTVVAEAYTAAGRLLGRDSDTARVGGRTGTTPSPTRKSPTTEPVESPVATEEAVVPTQEVAAALPNQTAAASDSGTSLGIGAMVMIVGVVMVVIGIALLVLLIRRGRTDRRAPAAEPATAGPPAGGWQTRVPPTPRPAAVYGGGAASGGGDPTMMLPGGGDRTVALPTGADPTMMLPSGGGDRTVALPGAGRPTPGRPGAAGPTPGRPGGGTPTLIPDPSAGRPGGGDPTLILPARTPPRQPRPAPPTPSASGSPTPSASGSPTPSASGSPTPSGPGSPIPSASGSPIPSASGSPAPSGPGSPAPSGAASPAPSGSGASAPAGSGSPTASDSGSPGQPPTAPGPDATLILPTNPPKPR
ncbi:hypothetical protein [Plantactinospora soyae]|uniref:Uncharacterized protein n=1 Tax=Plantactinospora soyae TaxID=1544732 RepID=A0A927R6W7_9ACTN|nr:hypothetical protein [Plantactinospora soyae]MBE1487306.1 hypothetical protein [Plantactinospora soyae]